MPLDEHWLLAVLENLPVAVLVADRDGRIVYGNRHAEEALGHKVDHVDGIAAYAMPYGVGDDGAPLAPKEYPLARALAGDVVPPTDYRYCRPDGRDVWLRAAASPILDANRVIGASVLFRNVDHERAAAEQLRSAIVEREQLEETLRKQAEALRDADRRKDHFLAALSHELRNPLGALTSAAAVLRLQAGLAPSSLRALGVVERQLAQITRLVDDLLEVSRISEGKIDLKLRPVDTTAIVAAAAETVRARVDARRQTLTIESSGEPMLIDGDAQRLTQVVVNLLNNASKYSDHGGDIVVVLRATEDHAEILVRDSGVGIPQEMQALIFNLFMQVDEHRERADGGLGLGLSLVHLLTRLHGGSVSVRSGGPGTGSEFVVRLPLLRRSTPAL